MFHNNNPIEFTQFIRDNIAIHFKTKTYATYNQVYTISVKPEEFLFFKVLFEKYGIPHKYNQEATEYIVEFLCQYSVNNLDAIKKNEQFINELNELSYQPISDEHLIPLLEKSAKAKFDEVDFGASRMIVFIDSEHQDEVRSVMQNVLNTEFNMETLNIKNQEYQIDGLSYFIIPKEYLNEIRRRNKFHRRGFLGILFDSNINCCLLHDSSGEINVSFHVNRLTNSRPSVVKFRDDLNSFLRSTWEANVARILNYKDLEWEYEKEVIQTDHGSYRPDFWLSNQTIIEVKGFWDSESRKKVSWVKENISKQNLLLLDSDMYFDLQKTYGHRLENWEEGKVNPQKENISIVGITIAERKVHLVNIKEGDELFLLRDPLNNFDKNAIMVLDGKQNHIGFVSKDWSAIYSEKIDIGMQFKVIVKEKKLKVIYADIMRSNFEQTILHPLFS